MVLAILYFLSSGSGFRFSGCRDGEDCRRAICKWLIYPPSNGGVFRSLAPHRFLLHLYWSGTSAGGHIIDLSANSNTWGLALSSNHRKHLVAVLRSALRRFFCYFAAHGSGQSIYPGLELR